MAHRRLTQPGPWSDRNASRRRLVLLALPLALLGCRPTPEPVAPATPPVEITVDPDPPIASPGDLGRAWFQPAAPYEAVELKVSAAGRRPAKLDDVANLDDFSFLDETARARLAQSGIVATPVPDPTPSDVYRRNSAERRASFVTIDALLDTFDRLADATSELLENGPLPERLSQLTLTMLSRSQAQFETVAGSEWKDAARYNSAYFAMAASLLGVESRVEPGAARLARRELELRAKPARPRGSTLFPYQLSDPTSPEVPTDSTEAITRYRDTLAWYRATPFATDYVDERGDRVEATRLHRQLLLLTHALVQPTDEPLRGWRELDQTLAFLDGTPDGLGPAEIFAAAAAVYGEHRRLRDYDATGKLPEFAARLSAVSTPGAGAVGRNQPGRVRVQLFGPPSAPERGVLQPLAELTPPDLGLALLSALGQPRAADYLDRTDRPLRVALGQASERAAETEAATWRSSLGSGRLWVVAGLTTQPTSQHPWQQRQPAWQDRLLVTSLATWVSARHRRTGRLGHPTATAPVAPAGEPPVAWLEPEPAALGRLGYLAEALSAGLEQSGLQTPELAAAWRAFGNLLAALEQMARRELAGEALSAGEQEKLAYVGDELRWILDGLGAGSEPEAVATDLGVGLGPLQVVYAVVPHNGQPYLARGAVFSYLNGLPTDPPWDDATWRRELAGGEAPAQPAWVGSYVIPNRFAPELPGAETP